MATGIKDKVAIIGMGCTKFGERWDVGAEELIVEAFQECIEDAGIDRKEIQAAWQGTCIDEVNVGKSALALALTLHLPTFRLPERKILRHRNRGVPWSRLCGSLRGLRHLAWP